MTTHPDVLFELVRDYQARLRKEAEDHNRVTELLRRSDSPAELRVTHRPLRRWFARTGAGTSAGTLAACAPAASE